jgi:hypothetical protein
VIFGALACWHEFGRGQHVAAAVLAILAVVLGPVGLVWPQRLRWGYVVWMMAAFPIGWVISHLVLAILFYGVFTPLALVFRLVGRDPLRRFPSHDGDSYWTPKPMPVDARSYLRQS